MSTEAVWGLLWGALAGLALGALFFLGLWATVTRIGRGGAGRTHAGNAVAGGAGSGRAGAAGAWLTGSFLLRLAGLGAGLFLVSRGGQWPLFGALIGILAARPLVTRLVVARSPEPAAPPRPDEATAEEASR